MVEVSVIIPVYNVENYLRGCLDSIVNQTFKDIEIICINDGSSDNSLNILEEYAKSDSRIRIITQENQGQGVARNNAIPLANGKYIYFMDSDDTLELNGLNDLYNIAEEKSLDIVIFKLINVEEESGNKYTERYYDMPFLTELVGDKVFNYRDVGEYLYKIAVSPPGKLFKRDLISDIRFDESLIFEDNPFFIEAFFKAKRVYFHNEYLYNRLRRKGSLMTTNSSFSDVIPISNMIVDITKKYGHFDEFKEGLFNKKIFSTYYRFTLVEDSFKQEFFDMIKKDFTSYRQDIESDIQLEPLNESIFQNVMRCQKYDEFEHYVNLTKEQLHELDEQMRIFKRNEIARIDIKNFGTETNSLIILNNSDPNALEDFQRWFTNKKGKGVVIESDRGEIDLKLKMINDGRLRLWLRSINIQDENNERIKCCIDYTSFIVNGEEYLNKNHNPFWHDDSFNVNKKVKDSEIVDIHIEWINYDKINVLVDDLNEKIRKHDRLTKQSFRLMNKLDKKQKENKKLKKELKMVYSSRSWNLTKPLRKIRNF